MNINEQYIIIGAGVSGVNAAATLRFEGFEGRVILIDKDHEFPYDRPPLSKDYLSGKIKEEDISLRAHEFFEKNNIELKLGKKVIDIDFDDQYIKLDDNEVIPWDKVLIAMGSKLRRLKIPGRELDNIYYLKTKKDAQQMKKDLKYVDDVVIIGAGFIGSEVAATCRQLGKKVTLIEAETVPLSKILGDYVGNFISDIHHSNGVRLLTNELVTEFKGTKKIEQVVTNTGKQIECQAVVVGVGVELDLSLFDGTKIKVEDGIEVDEYCESNIPGVFASGDCALWPYNGERIRVEHWNHAMNQGITAAKNMMNGKSEIYNTIPYFWSDQHDLKIQYLGFSKDWEKTVLRGSLEKQEFTMFYLNDNKIVSALFVNNPRNVLPTRKFMMRNTKIENISNLADEKRNIKKAFK
ncbi:NAD(P)/FAD-dependent oxidoreductase [Natribacillus halophilus]|uniref:3-phenylpropionate/trans-cinnamate dioxygenase ferredoxin reductase subunit n=1 Tax=Natribacillus halophilus TaxID=549003 RepID=A0A1G8KHX9_9BACI|nr:FAD-dependent oxidoreductase [Natribacillus halophilus]SDI43063.1 3-phenylpropionate/trans-cinnamate dioxygenase ferredoxin reductase subunit [Natribacillus halophilus]